MNSTGLSNPDRTRPDRPRLSSQYAAKLDRRLEELLPDCGRDERRRRIEGALDFLYCCSRPGAPSLAPTPKIDAVWHEMIMFTADYRALCRSLGVAFVDHEPLEPGAEDAPSVAQTVAFMRKCGISLAGSADLWSEDEAAKCCSGHISFD
jgi:hypothetical protein